MTIQEMTKHLRHRINVAGIKARVRISPAGGAVQVFVPQYGMEFSEAEQREIRHIAVCNRLTLVRGLPIIVDQMTNPHDFNFYLP